MNTSELREARARIRGQIALIRSEYDMATADLPDEFFDRIEPLETEDNKLLAAIHEAIEAERAAAPPRPKPSLPLSGWYPDLLVDDPRDTRGCDDPRPIKTGDENIRHFSCGYGSFHLIQFVVDGEIVSGMTLHASKKWRGEQSAVIDRVCTADAHRRRGYAAALLKYARRHFRRVEHSRDLTTDGKAWKRAVRNPLEDEIRSGERDVERAGDRESIVRLHMARLRAGTADYSEEAADFLKMLRGDQALPLWIPAWVRNLNWRDFDGAKAEHGLSGRFLIISKGVVMSVDDAWADTANTEGEASIFVLKKMFEDWPDSAPWYAILIVDLLLMEPLRWRFSVEVQGSGGTAGAQSGWLPPDHGERVTAQIKPHKPRRE